MSPEPIVVNLPGDRQGVVSSMYDDDGEATEVWAEAANAVVFIDGTYVGIPTSDLTVSE